MHPGSRVIQLKFASTTDELRNLSVFVIQHSDSDFFPSLSVIIESGPNLTVHKHTHICSHI